MPSTYFTVIVAAGFIGGVSIGPGSRSALLARAADAATPRPQDGRGAQGARGPAAPLTIKEVKPGLYMVSGGRLGGNTTIRVTDQGLMFVDTKNRGADSYNALMAQVRTISTAPVRYVFITHHHQDHSGNTGRFESAGAEVIAHAGVNKALDTYRPPAGTPEKPQATFTSKRTVTVGSAIAEVIFLGPAHTGADAWVYFPDVRVVATGDAVVANVPHIDYPFGGSAIGWVKALDEVLKWDFDVAIPGHGVEPMSKPDVQVFRDKLHTLVTRARRLVKAGTPKGELLALIKTDDFGWNISNPQWTSPERLNAFYEEMGK